MPSLEELRERWNLLYRTTLPQLAKSKDQVQAAWPVHFNHCFARIILDNAVGITKPWTAVVRSPAWKHMTREQLVDAIELGESIAVGEQSLVDLDERSLDLRGKSSKRGMKREHSPDQGDYKAKHNSTAKDALTAKDSPTMKRQRQSDVRGHSGKPDAVISRYFTPVHGRTGPIDHSKKTASNSKSTNLADGITNMPDGTKLLINPITNATYPSADPLTLISTSSLTPFRKEVLALLCRVPRGRYTTYAAMSDYISVTSHKTCARAVGNAMRNNPFAPVVPCHRVLAHDGQIGGFGGHWGEEGKFAGRKKEMLREEGVKFDGRGRAVGEPFRAFGG